MEQRWGTRATLNAPAKLRIAGDAPVDAVIGNASISGAYLLTDSRAPVLSRIQVRATTSDPEWLEACVVRHDEKGMGVQWLNPALRQVCALLALRQRPTDRASVQAAPRAPRMPSRVRTLLPKLP